MTVHSFQNGIADVLQRNVEVFADVGALPDHVEELHREVVGIGVVETDPTHTRHIGHTRDELRDVAFAVNIHTVVGQFLCDDLYLRYSLSHQFPHLLQDFVHRPTLVRTCDDGNSAIGAMAVAALGYL